MNNITRDKLILFLGFYYFEWKKNDTKALIKFTNQYNAVFKQDLNNQIAMYYCSLFKNVDSSYNAKPINNDDARIIELWNYYIIGERIDELKKIYYSFKKMTLTTSNIVPDESFEEQLLKSFNSCSFTFIDDVPKSKYINEQYSTEKAVRDVNVSFNALKIADFKCEVDANHPSFIRRNNNVVYTEGHHIIPLKYQYKYDVNLDVEANIVSLCSNCHNNLHYGKDYEVILKNILTEDRIKRLQKCGIIITLDELINMYQ